MKKLYILISLSLSLSFSLVKADYWTQKADFGGTPRVYAVGFSIGNKGYLGTGRDSSLNLTNDFWEYDAFSNTWTQKADFSGTPRAYATGFSIGNKGYVASGGSDSYPYSDFREYDPASNSWTQKNNFSGIGRLLAVSFSIGSKGYLGTGIVDLFTLNFIRSDFWEYNPSTDSWSQKSDVPSVLFGASGFSIGSKGYIGTGIWNPIMVGTNQFWEYDTTLNSWTQKASLNVRYEGVGLSIGNKGYIGNGVFQNDFWEYNVANDTWSSKTNYQGSGRYGAVGFSIGCKGYIGTGSSQPGGGIYFCRDFWEYTPDSACITGIEDASAPLSMTFTISPDPALQYAVINWQSAENKKVKITLTDIHGKKMYQKLLLTANCSLQIDLNNFSKGIYFVEVAAGKEKAVKKFVKE